MADEQPVEIPAPAPKSRKFLRLFLIVAGGLAAPCLALAAYFLTSTGSDDPPAGPAKQQAGRVTATTAPGRTPAAGTAATTTTTAPPAAPSGPLRDPFAPLVSTAPLAGTPTR